MVVGNSDINEREEYPCALAQPNARYDTVVSVSL